jgi:glycerol kinase
MAKYTLVIDQGGHSTRAIVFNKKGEPIAYSSEPILEALPSSEGFIEYAPESIIESTRLLLTRLPTQLKPKQLKKISNVGIIAQRSSLIACTKSGEAISSMISWQDTRHANWLESCNFDIAYIQKLTGLRLNAHAGASKIRWLLDNDVTIQQYAKEDNLLFVPWGAYFAFHLANRLPKDTSDTQIITDPILAARTGLVEYGQLDWSKELLTLFSIPRTVLPKIVSTSHHYGNLSLEEHTVSITLLGGDQNFIPYAYGKTAIKDSAFLNVGTGAFIQSIKNILKNNKAITDTGLLTTAAEIEKGKSHYVINEGTINAAATALDWWQEQLPRPYSFGELDSLLESKQEAPIFINTLAGTGSPYWLPQQPVKFISHNNEIVDTDQKTIAIIESIIFSIAVNFDYIYKENSTIQRLIISGGLSKINGLCQKLSDLIQIEVHRYKDSEASARGVVFYINDINEYLPKESPQIFSPSEKGSIGVSLLLRRFSEYQQAMQNISKQQSI